MNASPLIKNLVGSIPDPGRVEAARSIPGLPAAPRAGASRRFKIECLLLGLSRATGDRSDVARRRWRASLESSPEILAWLESAPTDAATLVALAEMIASMVGR